MINDKSNTPASGLHERIIRLIDPAPQWEESPTPDGSGYWGGRFRVLRFVGGSEPDVDVDEEWITPPDDMEGAEPEEIEGRWHWVLNSMPNATGNTIDDNNQPTQQ